MVGMRLHLDLMNPQLRKHGALGPTHLRKGFATETRDQAIVAC